MNYNRKKKRKLRLLGFLLVVLIGILTPMSSFASDPKPTATSTFAIQKKTHRMILGKKKIIQTTGFIQEHSYVTWLSDNPSIAEVHAYTGKVTAVSKGKTTIRVFLDGIEASNCTVIVEAPKLNKTKKKLKLFRTTQLKLNGTTQKVTWSSNRPKIATVDENGLVTARSVGEATIKAKVRQTSYSCKITVTASKMIALTFDDGPSPYTPIILDTLEKQNAKATFFVIGESINKTTKKYVKRAWDLGCEIGNHTYSHVTLTQTSQNVIDEELQLTDNILKPIIGLDTKIMRPPYGAISPAIVSNIDKSQILWSMDTLDWKYKDTNRLIQYVLNNAKDGDIVLMHDLHKTTANAIAKMVKGLKEKGFDLVTVSELAAAKKHTLKPYTKYYKF